MSGKKIAVLIAAVQLVVLGLAVLERKGFSVPVLRQALGFVYLNFIPGYLIVRVLRLHREGGVHTLLYSTGLSLALLMLTGFFINGLYPVIGINRPISLVPVTITLAAVVLGLCAVISGQKGDIPPPSTGESGGGVLSQFFTPPALFLMLLPVLSILGAMLVNIRDNNVLLLFLIPLIGLVPVLVAFDRFIPRNHYPLAIWSVSIALLWQSSMASWNLPPFDINAHYDLQKSVLDEGKWNPLVGSMSNGMMSVVMLAPLNSLMLQWDTVWIFKMVYPFFLSLVPIALFQIYRRQVGEEIAFIAAFFFISMPTFFFTLPDTMTQLIAEAFLALSLMLLFSSEVKPKHNLLLVVFAFALITSHYATSYVFLFYLLLAGPVLYALRTGYVRNLVEKISQKFVRGESIPFFQAKVDRATGVLFRSPLTGVFVAIYVIAMLSWYTYGTGGAAFSTPVMLVNQITRTLKTDFWNPVARDPQILQALGLAPMAGREVWWSIARYFQYAVQVFIIAGVIALLLSLYRGRFSFNHKVMALISSLLLGLSILLPFLTANFGPARIYHITLFFLAPFAILGGILVFRFILGIFLPGFFDRRGSGMSSRLVLLCVFMPYFLFTTGFVFEITKSKPTSHSLSSYREDFGTVSRSDVIARDWLKAKANPYLDSTQVATDYAGVGLISQRFYVSEKRLLEAAFAAQYQLGARREQYYLFVRKWTASKKELKDWYLDGARVVYGKISLKEETLLNTEYFRRSRIYDSGSTYVMGPQ